MIDRQDSSFALPGRSTRADDLAQTQVGPSARSVPSELLFNQLTDAGFARIEHVDVTGSTNADLLADDLLDRAQPPALRWADHQITGRGRRGRQWLDRPGQALMFSVAIERELTNTPAATPVAAFSLVAGLTVAQTLADSALNLSSLHLKWPNDVLLDGRKVVGILVEVRQTGAVQRMVVGCGINLLIPPSQATAGRAGTALAPGGLLEEEHGQARECSAQAAQTLVAMIALRLVSAHQDFFANGLTNFREHWMARNFYQDQSIDLIDYHKTLAQGRCMGIDEQGALLIDTEHGQQAFMIGEVSARASSEPLAAQSTGAF